MQTNEFSYTNNRLNLLFGLSGLGICAYMAFGLVMPSFHSLDISLVIHVFYFLLLSFILWCSFHRLNTFRKFFGKTRKILISQKSIIFPEHADSFTLIELDFSQISEVYFGMGRHGIPGNLIIEYDSKGHASIGKDYLDNEDFDEICNLFKLRLGLKNIKTEDA